MLRICAIPEVLQSLGNSAHEDSGVWSLGVLFRPLHVVLDSFIYIFDGIAKAYWRL